MGKDNIAISLLNVYSTVIVKVGSQTILFDPVEVDPDRFSDLSLIIVTHEHVDHFDKKLVTEIQRKTEAKILTTPFIAKRLCTPGNSVISMEIGDSFRIKRDLCIYAEYSKHVANQPLVFFIQSSLATIFHPNDSEYFPEMETLREKYHPLIMIFLGTSMQNLLNISAIIKPEVIISYAYPFIGSFNLPGTEIVGTEIVTLKQFAWYYYPPNAGIDGLIQKH
ncbi:MAG: MBL fold metallo-hydrolase [Syntrophales bacterium]|nr:MBL fold metallo-hydrolase [Syntrophales bacterium]